jgi:hypothetical protein
VTKKIMNRGRHKGEERMVVDTLEEAVKLKNARSYFPDARTFMCKGLSYPNVGRSPTGAYTNIGISTSVSLEDWSRIEHYASLFAKGERYEPKKFVRPSFT